MYKEFGIWLRRGRTHYKNGTRRKVKITLQKVHELTGYSPGYISTIERGVPHYETGGYIRPSEEFIHKMAEVLELDERAGRLLAGYREDSAPVTLRDIDKIIKETGRAVYAPSGTSGQLIVMPEELLSELQSLAKSLHALTIRPPPADKQNGE